MPETIILALNSGSSSLKFGLFTAQHDEVSPLSSGAAEGIGSNQGRFWIRSAKGEVLKDEPHAFAEQQEAVRAVAQALGRLPFPTPAAIGHRIVHGGPKLCEHQLITAEVLAELEAAASFAPLHVPIALTMIRQAQQHFPACRSLHALTRPFTARCRNRHRSSHCPESSGTPGSAATDFMDSPANPYCTGSAQTFRRA